MPMVYLSDETVKLLSEIKADIKKELGIEVNDSQAISHLCQMRQFMSGVASGKVRI